MSDMNSCSKFLLPVGQEGNGVCAFTADLLRTAVSWALYYMQRIRWLAEAFKVPVPKEPGGEALWHKGAITDYGECHGG